MTFARTKIQPPRPRSAYVERALVQARLADALLNRRVALLCAPAGYGKTTALAHEIARLPPEHAVAWISADAGDDLQRLLECMLAALEPFDPPWRTAPESLVSRVGGPSSEEQRTLAAEIINTLDACEVAHGIIAFEDVHRVDDPAFFGFLDLLIERLSSRWSVAITSRTDPPLALARLRARDELAEFRQLQLQFARDDARRLAANGVWIRRLPIGSSIAHRAGRRECGSRSALSQAAQGPDVRACRCLTSMCACGGSSD